MGLNKNWRTRGSGLGQWSSESRSIRDFKNNKSYINTAKDSFWFSGKKTLLFYGNSQEMPSVLMLLNFDL